MNADCTLRFDLGLFVFNLFVSKIDAGNPNCWQPNKSSSTVPLTAATFNTFSFQLTDRDIIGL